MIDDKYYTKMLSKYQTCDVLLIDEGIESRLYEMCKDYVVEIEKRQENNYRLR